MIFHIRAKKRLNQTLVPVPADLNPTNDPLMAVTLRRNMFFTELKDSNNRYNYNDILFIQISYN